MSQPKRPEDAPLQCPRCIKKMRKQRHARAVIDHCEECSGNFFDEGEMLAVLGKSADPEVWARSNRKLTPSASDISCPRCHKRMQLHPLGVEGHEVDIDLCISCGGIWLDGGEIDHVMQIGARQLAASAQAKATKQPKPPAEPDSGPELIGQFLSLFPPPEK